MYAGGDNHQLVSQSPLLDNVWAAEQHGGCRTECHIGQQGKAINQAAVGNKRPSKGRVAKKRRQSIAAAIGRAEEVPISPATVCRFLRRIDRCREPPWNEQKMAGAKSHQCDTDSQNGKTHR